MISILISTWVPRTTLLPILQNSICTPIVSKCLWCSISRRTRPRNLNHPANSISLPLPLLVLQIRTSCRVLNRICKTVAIIFPLKSNHDPPSGCTKYDSPLNPFFAVDANTQHVKWSLCQTNVYP